MKRKLSEDKIFLDWQNDRYMCTHTLPLFIYFLLSNVALAYVCFFGRATLPLHFLFLFFSFPSSGHQRCLFIFLFFQGSCLFFLFFPILFFFFWFSRPRRDNFFFLTSRWFFFLDMIFFFNKFGWLFSFFGYLSIFCFNWASFFNKSKWVNLFKLIFFHLSTFSFLTKQKWEKIIYFLSFHFFILPPFFIILFFHHHSNQTDPKRVFQFFPHIPKCLV